MQVGHMNITISKQWHDVNSELRTCNSQKLMMFHISRACHKSRVSRVAKAPYYLCPNPHIYLPEPNLTNTQK